MITTIAFLAGLGIGIVVTIIAIIVIFLLNYGKRIKTNKE